MGIVLPENVFYGYRVSKCLEYISADNVQHLRNMCRPRKLDVLLPKVRIETTIDLIPVLQAMGFNLPFANNEADFSGIK